jgi:hypothetical protein
MITNKRKEDAELDEDHDYPFEGSKHLDPIGVNHELVRLTLRTGNDFAAPEKLKNAFIVIPQSKGNYE